MELSDVPKKNPGIEPGTLRIVAQCLNPYATPGPPNRKVNEEIQNIFFLRLDAFLQP
jgi:hypothetical protein